MKRIFWVVIILFFSYSAADAQRTWFEFEISKSLGDKLQIGLAPQIRFKEKFELHEYFFEPNIEYKFNKYFSLGANYRIGNNPDKDGNAQWYGRYALEAKTGYEWRRLEAKFRLRYTNTDDFGGEPGDQINYLRFKFQLEYDIKEIDLKPYAAYEAYRNLVEGDFTKVRWEGGLEYKINKHHRVGAYYRLNDYLVTDDETFKIIGLTYKFSF
ncbi:MAG TPA: DUF2490 domain-containing protein [Draconibacterium sp.]|nr:DUF2490 domain-containing protein [Draconibacterium sp.]